MNWGACHVPERQRERQRQRRQRDTQRQRDRETETDRERESCVLTASSVDSIINNLLPAKACLILLLNRQTVFFSKSVLNFSFCVPIH